MQKQEFEANLAKAESPLLEIMVRQIEVLGKTTAGEQKAFIYLGQDNTPKDSKIACLGGIGGGFENLFKLLCNTLENDTVMLELFDAAVAAVKAEKGEAPKKEVLENTDFVQGMKKIIKDLDVLSNGDENAGYLIFGTEKTETGINLIGGANASNKQLLTIFSEILKREKYRSVLSRAMMFSVLENVSEKMDDIIEKAEQEKEVKRNQNKTNYDTI